jgi:RHS repeat-associated protein
MLSVGVNTKNQINNSGFVYDAAGNLTADGSLTMTYDAENRMVSTNAGVSYTYDGDGRRVKKGTTKLYWYGAGSDTMLETDASGNNPTEYVFFNGRRVARRSPSGAVNFYFADHLGSSRVVTNATGTILDDSDFYPFGGERVVTSTSGNNYKFTGHERDSETGLDNYGFRYYGSSLGRFMSPDEPFVDQFESDPQSWNLYSYVRNNPLAFFDPTGRSCVKTTSPDGTEGWGDDGDGKGCDKAGVAPDDEGGAIEPAVVIVSALDGMTQDERIFELSYRIYHNTTDLSVYREGIRTANPVAGAIVDCGQGNCGGEQALAFIPFGKGLKHVRLIKSGRLNGFVRGVTQLAGGDSGARSFFQQHAGRPPVGQFDRVVQGNKEFVFRAPTRTRSLSAAVEIIDHGKRTLEVIHFQ